jgi:hypothetical protein
MVRWGEAGRKVADFCCASDLVLGGQGFTTAANRMEKDERCQVWASTKRHALMPVASSGMLCILVIRSWHPNMSLSNAILLLRTTVYQTTKATWYTLHSTSRTRFGVRMQQHMPVPPIRLPQHFKSGSCFSAARTIALL